jgi:hypothetical protein
MDNEDPVSRRRFLTSAGALTGASIFRIGAPALAVIAQSACSARDAAAPFQTLGDAEAADFRAISARIIPTTDTPGANEAGVIYFWDNVLGGSQARLLPVARSLREELNDSLGRPFSELTADEQDEALRRVETDGRFMVWRNLTMFGFFAMARYGGNKDHISWELVGYKGHHGAWAPPFGYYDAHYEGGESNDE